MTEQITISMKDPDMQAAMRAGIAQGLGELFVDFAPDAQAAGICVTQHWHLFSDTDKNAIQSAILRAERKIAAQKIRDLKASGAD